MEAHLHRNKARDFDAWGGARAERSLAKAWTEILGPDGRAWSGQSQTWRDILRLRGPERIDDPYAQSVWVYACTRVRAQSLAAARLRLWSSRDANAAEIEGENELARLLRRPNPIRTQRAWVTELETYLLLAGDVLVLRADAEDNPTPAGQMPVRLYLMRGHLAEPGPADPTTRVPTTWTIPWGSTRRDWPMASATMIADLDPFNPTRGLAVAAVALRAAEIQFQAQRLDEALAANGGEPGLILTMPVDAGNLNEPNRKRLERNMRERHQSSRNGRSPLVLSGGMSVEVPAFNPKDMEMVEMRKWYRDEIMAAFGVTKPLIGIVEDVNLANGREARRIFYETTVEPRWRQIEDELEVGLSPFLPPKFQGIAIGFADSEVPAMRDDQAAQLVRAKMLWDMGATLPAALRMVGIEEELTDADIRPAPAPSFGFGSGLGGFGSDGATDDEEPPEAKRARAQKAKAAPAGLTPEQRRAVSKAYDEALQPHDRAIARAVAQTFRDYVLAARKLLRENAPPAEVEAKLRYPSIEKEMPSEEVLRAIEAYLPQVGEFSSVLGRTLTKPMRVLFEKALKQMARQLGSSASLVLERDPNAFAALSAKAIEVAEGVTSTWAGMVRDTIARQIGGEELFTVQTIAQALEDQADGVMSELSAMTDRIPERALMIARTETGAIANAARDSEMRATGVTKWEWVSANDAATRPSHDIDGEQVDVGEPFSNGLTRPHAPGAPAGEVINCRCAVVPVADEFGSFLENFSDVDLNF